PIPMYAKKIFNGPPAFNEEVGYDLVVGDWVAPHGKGKQKDFIFLGQLQKKSNEEFDYKLVIKFANPSDGIQEFQVPADLTSELRSPYEAPDSGYEREVVRRLSRKPGQGTKNDADKNRNFFFRVRTVLDPNGNIQSANYGKIYGDFMDFTYFFNPEVNSRNLEFNPSKNLFGNLPPSERVEEP
ncbi:MAG: hypothetical protein JWM16_1723, partial [Verrucomicrobiales bacterium]|nr:hypothetical protein [Verrucomicrobiales bacterium]